MKYGSFFSGAGGLDLGLHRAGHRAEFFCESDPYRRRVLARHWPTTPCYEDVRDVNRQGKIEQLDGAVGGFPCQDVSVAGHRRGLAGARSGLFFEFARCADELVRPGGWIIVENVPGLLSSNGGRDFGVVLRTLGDIGFHDLSWRVLDSRYFGVPQRRRRVFLVARRASGECSQAVLLEREGGAGDFAPGAPAWTRAAADAREGADVAGTVRSHVRPGSNDNGGLVSPDVAAPLTKGSAAGEGVSYPGRRKEDDENLVTWAITSHVKTGADENFARGGHLVPSVTSHYGKGPDSDATDAMVIEDVGDEQAAADAEMIAEAVTADPLQRDAVAAEVSAPVTAKWAKGNGGPAGDEVQNLTFERSHRSSDGEEPDKWTETEVAPTLNDHDLGSGPRSTALAVKAFHAYHGYEQDDGVQTLTGGASGGSLSLHDGPLLVEPDDDQQAFNLMPAHGTSGDVEAYPTDEASGVNGGMGKQSDRGTRVVTMRTAGAGGANNLGVYEHGDAPTLDGTGDVGVVEEEVAPTLLANGGKDSSGKQGNRTDKQPTVLEAGAVRRLTPTECERLQALPDGWTMPWGVSLADRPFTGFHAAETCPVDYQPDGPRYAACGDAVTATVAEWIGDRIGRVRCDA